MTRGFFDTPSLPSLWGSIIPFIALDIVVVILRFFTRRRLRQAILLDDWLTIPALIGIIGLSVLYFYGLGMKALGYRWALLPPPGVDPDSWVPEFAEQTQDRIVLTRRTEYSSLIIHTVANACIKLSVLAFYKRIFVVVPHWKNGRNMFFTVMMVLIAMWSGAYVFTFIFMCRTSIQVLFKNPEELVQKCVDTFMVGYIYSILDFITDGLIILIPIPFILKLQLPTRRKFAVLGVFLLGFLATGASLVRLAWMVYNKKVGFSSNTDEELMITTELYWMQLEITLGLLASCLPTLHGLFKNLNSVDSVIRGVRSIFSVRSGSFNESIKTSQEYDRDGNYKSKQISVDSVDTEFSRTSHAHAHDRV